MANEIKIVGGAPQNNTIGVPGAEQVVDGTFGAGRVSIKPAEYAYNGQVLGHYALAAVSGATTILASGALIYAFRWAQANAVAQLHRITVSAQVSTAFTTAQTIDIDAINVRGWLNSDTGGTSLLFFPQSNKTRSNMGNSLINSGDLRIASTTALAAGTKNADASPFASAALMSSTTVVGAAAPPIDLYNAAATPGQYPMTYALNEGFNLRIVTTQVTPGAVKYYIRVDWAELPGF